MNNEHVVQRGPPRPDAIPAAMIRQTPASSGPPVHGPPEKHLNDVVKTLGLTVSRPTPVAPTLGIYINTLDMLPFITDMYNTLFDLLFPGHEHNVRVIDEEDFVLTTRRLIQSRIYYVQALEIGNRPGLMQSPLFHATLPKCLVDLLDGIGAVTIMDGRYNILPDSPPADNVVPNLEALVTADMLKQYSRFIMSLSMRGLIRTAIPTAQSTGKYWWLLGATTANAVCDGNADQVIVRSAFHECTVEDYLYAAIVQRRNTGEIPDRITALPLRSPEIHGVMNIRAAFISKA